MEQIAPDLRVMVDANILIAGIVWPRWSYEVLQHALRGDYRLILSDYIINQGRRRIQSRFPDFMDNFELFLVICRYELAKDPTIDQVNENINLVRDTTDIPIVLAAIQAEVDHLVSEDKDLTAMDGTTLEIRHNLSVMMSGTFLKEVMGWNSDDLEQVRGRTWLDLRSSNEYNS